MVALSNRFLRVGVGGLGAIGWPVVRRLAQGMPGLMLAAVAARDLAKAGVRLAENGIAGIVRIEEAEPLLDRVERRAMLGVFV